MSDLLLFLNKLKDSDELKGEPGFDHKFYRIMSFSSDKSLFFEQTEEDA